METSHVTLRNYIQVNGLRNLAEFLARLSTDNNDVKGQLFEQLTEYFLSQYNMKLYKPNEESLTKILHGIDNSVREKLVDLCRMDIGIDFISTFMSGGEQHIRLIQSKYRSTNITLSDIATFLATSNEFIRCINNKDIVCKCLLFCNQPLTSNARKLTIDIILNISEYANDKYILSLFPTSEIKIMGGSNDKLTIFFSKCKVADLKKMCDANKVNYNRKGKKAEIIDAIVNHLS